MKISLLRLFLGLGAATWGAAVPGVFLSWDAAAAAMQGLGAGEVVQDRMLEYWLRMASGAFGLVGGIYLVLLIRPRRFRDMIPWMGGFALVEGLVLLVHGLKLGLSPWPFYGDVSACLVSGGGILGSWWLARGELYSGAVESQALPRSGSEASPSS